MEAMNFTSKRDRESVLLMARVAPAAGEESTGHRVRNLSRDGVCIEYPGRLEQHDRLDVSIGQLDRIAGEVAWARGGFAGIRFAQPIDPMLARKHRAAKPVDVRAGWMTDLRHAHRR